MKFLLIFLSFALIENSCGTSKQNQDLIVFEYTASTRGSYKHIVINSNDIKIAKKRDSRSISKVCSKTDWEKLTDILKNINLENIPNLEAPSEKRFFDGAAIANLKITLNEKTYKTKNFDDGNPPKEIAVLVKEILSIAQNIE